MLLNYCYFCRVTPYYTGDLLLTKLLLLLLFSPFIGFVSEKVQLLLDTMTEISRILYAKVPERCQKSVLRFHNQTFLHAIACEEVIGKPIVLAEKTFYGHYLHSLMCHAPIQHRIICSRSTTKQQERHFNTFASIYLATSSRRPGEIITPGLIRMQAEMKRRYQQTKYHSRAVVTTWKIIKVLTKSRK